MSTAPEPPIPDESSDIPPVPVAEPAPEPPAGSSRFAFLRSYQLRVWQRVVAAVLAVLAGAGAFVVWFVGVVVFTGCFIKCDYAAADPVGGTLLFLLAAVLFVAGVLGAQLTVTGSTRQTRTTAPVAAAAAAVAVVVTVAQA